MTPIPPEGSSDPSTRGPRFGGLFSFGVERGPWMGEPRFLVLGSLRTYIGVSATDFSSDRFKVEFKCPQCPRGSKTVLKYLIYKGKW